MGFLIFLSLIVFAVALLTFNLDKVLKPELIAGQQEQYVPDLNVDWDKIKIGVENIGFFTKGIKISSTAQCVKFKTSEFCHESFLLEIIIAPFGKPHLKLLKLKLLEQKNKINLEDFASEEEQPWQPVHTIVYDLLETLKDNIYLGPQNFEISSMGTAFQNGGSIFDYESELSSDKVKLKYRTKGLLIEVANKEPLNFSGSLKNQFEFKFSNESSKIVSRIDLSVVDQKLISKINLSLDFKSKEKLNLKTNLILEINSDELKITMSELRTDYEPYLEELKINKCQLVMSSDSGQNIELECLKNSFLIATDSFKTKWSKKNVADLGPFFFKFKASLNEKVLLNLKEGDIGEVSYVIEEKKGAFFNLKSNASARLFKKMNTIGFEPKKFNLDLDIFSYEKMVIQLASSPFAVPAPFNSFKGEIKISTDDLIIGDKIEIPLAGLLNLKGAEDSVINISARGGLDLVENSKGQYEPSVKLDVELGEIVLYLPDFDPLRGLPKLNSDSRIVYGNQQKSAFLNTSESSSKKGAGFKYNVNIVTKNSDSIKFKYKLFKPYLPLGLKAQVSNKGITLDLFSTKTWAVEYLKRKVFISKMSLKKSRISSESYDVDALIVYKASEYDVFIKVVGDVESPAVSLRSDPPLSRADIISVLLYNRTADDIDKFQSESVGGAEAAFSDRALGLVGIWAFASTPIESVSYDSRSKTYRAQIGLPGGVKFDIGTDWERVQNLSLRKRITKYWMVVTSYQPGSDENEGIGDVLIQREWIF